MEDCGSSRLSLEFLRVKEESVLYLPPLSVEVKVEPLNEQDSDILKEEESPKDAECVNDLKEELSCLDSVDCGVSEAAMLAGLYIDHEVKDEVVLGPECPHRPDVNLVVREIHDKRLRNCIKLERLPSYDEHQTPTQDTTNHTDSESDQEEIYSRDDCKKEPICDLCGECFTLKSDLVKHVIQHIHVPNMEDESQQDGVELEFAGQCKQELAQERVFCRKFALPDCCVRLERLHSDALLAGNQRRTPALQTITHADSESDTEAGIHNNVNCDKDPTCDICGQSFALKTDLKKHVIIHIHTPTAHDQFPAATIHSDRLSDTEEEIDISVDCEKEPVCDFCGAKFTLYSNLMKHFMIHSFGKCAKQQPGTGEINIYACDTCGKAFQRKYDLKHHIQNKHLVLTHTSYSYACGMPKSKIGELYSLYSCNICPRQFTTSSGLKIHTRVHTGEKPYSCKVCNKSFAHKDTLVRHTRIHTGEKPYSCTICDKRFRQSWALSNHRSIHTGDLPYSCTICKKRFRQLLYLKRHKVMHSIEMPYSCTICNKGFRRSWDLSNHRSIHTGDLPYSCTICKKRFRQLPYLKNHKVMHSIEMPYSCTICNKGFRRPRDLSNHRSIHTGDLPYSCTICKKRFRCSTYLKKHKKLHSMERPYSCTICNKGFRHLSNLKTHNLIHIETYSCETCGGKFRTEEDLKEHVIVHAGEKL